MKEKSLMNDFLKENFKRITYNINEIKLKYCSENDNIRLMAVTKTVEPEHVNHVVSLGVKLLGENRVQEFLSKHEKYTKKTKIHFIGGLQSNKVKYIIDKVDLIQSVDNLKLAAEIDKQATKHSLIMDILIEVNIGNEQTKNGVSSEYDTIRDFINELTSFKNLKVRGLMTIPPFICQNHDSERYFAKMNELFHKFKQDSKDECFNLLSMGMSNDYQYAIKHGANIIRIGSALFGKR